MAQEINSIEVILQHEDGPDCYRVGNKIHPEGTVIHRIAEAIMRFDDHTDREYRFYDESNCLIMRIENCPVVVRYKPE